MIAGTLQLSLPGWVEAFLAGALPQALDDQAAVRLSIALARKNVEEGTGGPFGAVVFDSDSGELIAVGVNRVNALDQSIAHAEILALGLAQAEIGTWDLGRDRHLTLATSCEPCAMCFGALPWSGIRRVLCAALTEDAEEVGFDEGDKPADWISCLEQRGVDVATGIERESAREVFSAYQSTGGHIYNASRQGVK